MSEPTRTSDIAGDSTSLFTAPPSERNHVPLAAIFGAVAAIVVLVGSILFATDTRKAPPAGAMLPLDAYAASLPLSDVAMSESTSLSGGKSTFIDGHVRNTGSRTVNQITVQVLFRNDVGLAPQVETLPLQLIRTHEPYVDTQPVSAAPIAPGEEREFRLPFEKINDNWNIQIPEIHIVRVGTK